MLVSLSGVWLGPMVTSKVENKVPSLSVCCPSREGGEEGGRRTLGTKAEGHLVVSLSQDLPSRTLGREFASR